MFLSVQEPSVSVVRADESQGENKDLILICQVTVSEQVSLLITVNISWYLGYKTITPALANTASVTLMSNSMYEGQLTITQLQVSRDNGSVY